MTSSKSETPNALLCPRCGDRVPEIPDGWIAPVCDPCQGLFEKDCAAALSKHRRILKVSVVLILSLIILSIALAQPLPIVVTVLALSLMLSWLKQEKKRILESHYKTPN